MNRRRVMGVGAAVVLAGLGSVGVISWANSTKQSAEAQEAQTPVVIVDHHVPKGANGATIEGATHVGSVQQKALQPGALTSEAEIGNQVAISDLEPGDQLIAARLGAAVNDLPARTVEMSPAAAAGTSTRTKARCPVVEGSMAAAAAKPTASAVRARVERIPRPARESR